MSTNGSVAIVPAFSVGTNLSATLVDANGVVWAEATVVITLALPPNAAPPILFNGLPFQMQYRLIADNTGHIALTIPDNLSIVPRDTSWHFSISPNADSSVSVQFNVILSVLNQDISPTFTFQSEGQIEKLVQSFPIPRAKDVSQVAIAPNDGQLYYNTSLDLLYIWTKGAWVPVATGGGGGGGAIIEATNNIIRGDGTGNAVSTGIPATDVARLSIGNIFTAALNTFNGQARARNISVTGFNTTSGEWYIPSANMDYYLNSTRIVSYGSNSGIQLMGGALAATTFLDCQVGGATFGVPVILAADPVTAMQAATKQYVDALTTGNTTRITALENNRVLRAGDTMTGTLLFNRPAPDWTANDVVLGTGTSGNSSLYINAQVWAGLGKLVNGYQCNAGWAAHAEGANTNASGNNSHAEGQSTIAGGGGCHAEGIGTNATGAQCHAEGWNASATGNQSHAEGWSSSTPGSYSHAEGEWTQANAQSSHAEGRASIANGYASHAEGWNNFADGFAELAIGMLGVRSNAVSTAPVPELDNSGFPASHNRPAFTIGNGYWWDSAGGTVSTLVNSNAFQVTFNGGVSHGVNCNATSAGTYAAGINCTASGAWAHAEGSTNQATATQCHVEGFNCQTWSLADSAHAEGQNCVAGAIASHAEGSGSSAIGIGAHAEGSSQAQGANSHSEGGWQGIASAFSAHTEGASGAASGFGSHCEGVWTVANQPCTHAGGAQTIANSSCMTAIGFRNSGDPSPSVIDPTTWTWGLPDYTPIFTANSQLFAIGNGSSENSRSNCFVVDVNGVAQANALIIGGSNTTLPNTTSGIGTIPYPNTNVYIGSVGFPATGGNLTNGNQCNAPGVANHAEGWQTTTGAWGCHAEGASTQSNGPYSHAEGTGCTTLADSAHAEGVTTVASGNGSHTEGHLTGATGFYSHAEGFGSVAGAAGGGVATHAEGIWTTAAGFGEHASGIFNFFEGTADPSYPGPLTTIPSYTGKIAFTIGNGYEWIPNPANIDGTTGLPVVDIIRSNAFRVDFDGKVYIMNPASGVTREINAWMDSIEARLAAAGI